ncbi:hypothetical protein [Streptomyces albireticuli]|uniref:hypothetical protein n=1 Tax=Streptomyces albireticuli TaxID=1940 RepID=UPI0036CD2FC4
MNNRQGRDLHRWIARVQADDLPALHTFTTGLGHDLDAVAVVAVVAVAVAVAPRFK